MLVFVLVTTALAFTSRTLLSPILEMQHPFATFYVAVVLCAWFGGFPAGMLCTALSVLPTAYFWLEPARSMRVEEKADVWAIVWFVGLGVIVSLLNEGMFRAAEKHRQANARAEAAVRARDQELAVVSHDLRSPLGAIVTSAELLSRSAPSGEALVRRAAIIRRAAKQMSSLIGDLLDSASIDAGSFAIDPEALRPCEAGELLGEATELVEHDAATKSVQIDARVVGHPVAVCGHERALQVLTNLLGNAVKFVPEGGRIDLSAEAAGAFVRFAVSDNGRGIARENLGRIFDRYWSGSRATGAGLGLYIAKGIVEAHGGAIDVQSKPGVGSTFYFTLPAASAGGA
jgi:signal transduction histidine kinase